MLDDAEPQDEPTQQRGVGLAERLALHAWCIFLFSRGDRLSLLLLLFTTGDDLDVSLAVAV